MAMQGKKKFLLLKTISRFKRVEQNLLKNAIWNLKGLKQEKNLARQKSNFPEFFTKEVLTERDLPLFDQKVTRLCSDWVQFN
jgi:hypothetical protein